MLSEVRDNFGMLEEFVYSPPIAQTKPRDVNVVSVEMEAEGMLVHGPGGLIGILESWDYAGGKRPHALYVVPYVQLASIRSR